MNAMEKEALKPSKEQIIYANLLLIGAWLGIFIMVVTYGLYVSGLLAPHVDLHMIPGVWCESVHEYLEITHSPHGWGWLSLIGKGDFINYIGFMLLGVMTIICYLVLVRGYFRQKNWIFAVISILEILVLAVAASGIVGGGGH